MPVLLLSLPAEVAQRHGLYPWRHFCRISSTPLSGTHGFARDRPDVKGPPLNSRLHHYLSPLALRIHLQKACLRDSRLSNLDRCRLPRIKPRRPIPPV